MSLCQPAVLATRRPDDSLALLEEITHRVLNDYTRAIASLRLAANLVDDATARHAVLEAAQCLHARAEAHRALQAPFEANDIHLGDYLEEVCATISAAALAGVGIRLIFGRATAIMSADRCWRFGLIVAELVTNAARHGLGWSAGDIRVDLSATPSEVCCTVTDNGRSARRPTMGKGTQIVSTLVEGCGGGVEWFFKSDGVCVIVRIPR